MAKKKAPRQTSVIKITSPYDARQWARLRRSFNEVHARQIRTFPMPSMNHLFGWMPVSTNAPLNPANGDVYYDLALNTLRKYKNGSWQN